MTATRKGWAKKWLPDDHVIGYAELTEAAKSSNRRFFRRVFYLRETDYPFGADYPPSAANRPSEAVDPLTIRANFKGELTTRSKSASAMLPLIYEERRSDIEYETHRGRSFLVLHRLNLQSPTDPCPFCGRKHFHGIGDGHRTEHCVGERMRDEVVALDGTRLSRSNGYVIRTVAALGG